MYTIVGLGNPGDKYEKTRHNAGRIVLQDIFCDFDTEEIKEDMKTKSLCTKATLGKEKIIFVMPDNFMNNSGKSVTPFIKSKKDLERLVVLYDDVDIPMGKIKLSFNRNSGGHNGLESIIKNVKSKEFLRIRIGIVPLTPSGKPKKPKGEKAVIDFLMKDFKDPEIKTLKKVSKKVSEILKIFIEEGKEEAIRVGNTG